ncbi:protein phosphatase 2C domain-containing protein [Herbidospora galbida]|uniref:Protein phosphatase 2C domain-containing protein n=1 Tax=Herbidospora galbida TaxID=2575442 RepID=A0A4U3MGT2_9ACTN|nr:protein phosphatase 2C domain-containing protein [Herbidospora galbida]TKK87167.1 protein phosphatase 2C domain-containing protein [Herbidospora galbida]
MRITYESRPAPDRRNEDFVVGGPTWVAVLDGATAPAGVDSGCVHDVPWLVSRLASDLARGMITRGEASLADILEQAIRSTVAAHVDTCDIANPDSPSSTVAIVRRRRDLVDYLVLCDSPIVLRRCDGTLTVVDDGRTEQLPGGRPYSLELVRSLRNRPGGFWVASTRPEAAREALTGTIDADRVNGVLLMTDGVSRLVTWFGRSWRDLVDLAEGHGPSGLIEQVRAAEEGHEPPHGAKRHDDATAAWMTWAEDAM